MLKFFTTDDDCLLHSLKAAIFALAKRLAPGGKRRQALE